MREILFRGKRIDSGEWTYGGYKGEKVGGYLTAVFIIEPLTNGVCLQNRVDPKTVGQYTGLTDKNGTKIFEGDVCRNTKNGEVVSVKWHGTLGGYVWSKPREDSGHLFEFGELFRVHDKYEVIGNIHDNSELLKGENDA